MNSGKASVWFVATFGLLLIGLAVYPPSRKWLQEWIQPGYEREIIATVEGNLLNDGKLVKVIKYKGPGTIFLEIMSGNELIGRIILPDKHDGLFNLQGRVTKLAIADIDNDGVNELMAPTFDDQLVPHLNIYRYNPANKQFEAVKPP